MGTIFSTASATSPTWAQLSAKKLKHEGTVVVSVAGISHDEALQYFSANAKDLVQHKGRILVLTGCHGVVDEYGNPTGQDGVNELRALEAGSNEDEHNLTWQFYELWAESFGHELTEDPRVYTEQIDSLYQGKKYLKVSGIKTLTDDEMPKPVPNTYRQGIRHGTDINVLDVAFFHKRDKDLVAFIRDFAPTTLIISWCFTATSYTANLLARSGIISNVIAENDKYLVTGVKDRSIIKLGQCPVGGSRCDKCQGDVLHYVQQDIEDTTLEERWKLGSITTISGPAGSGKTCLGPEVARMIGTWRRGEEGKPVNVIFTTSMEYGEALMETMKESGTLGIIVGGVHFQYIEDLFNERLPGRKWDGSEDYKVTGIQLQELMEALSLSSDRYVMVVDEISCAFGVEDWSCLTCYPGVDLVLLCHPHMAPCGKVPLPSSEEEGVVRHHSLHTSYRQKTRPGRMARFVRTHHMFSGAEGGKSWLEENKQEEVEGRSEGEVTLWVEAGEGMAWQEVMERVKEEIGEESVTVLYGIGKPPKVPGWKYNYEGMSFQGSEDEVSVNVSVPWPHSSSTGCGALADRRCLDPGGVEQGQEGDCPGHTGGQVRRRREGGSACVAGG